MEDIVLSIEGKTPPKNFENNIPYYTGTDFPKPYSHSGSFFNSGSLTKNRSSLYNALWRALLEVRLKAMDYEIISEDPIKVRYEPPLVNPPESSSLNGLYSLCEKEAAIITHFVYEFVKAAKKSLHVKVPHGTEASGPEDLVLKHKSQNLDNLYFDIEEGGDSVPKGLEI